MAENNPQDTISQVVERIQDSENVLIALSKSPSVDELSAALALSFMLDKIGKRATAIFSGDIPRAMHFLEPEKTFETNTDSLQDFIISLNKDKADHLRYKVEGDFVKVFITPYKTSITKKDIEFSHGDYNVDLVIALNVQDATQLDAALNEYKRIMHDATSINISAGASANFGDLKWSHAESSSVSEMIGTLSDSLKGEEELIDKTVATALLTGIVAATERFSNEKTTPTALSLSGRLMSAGADQQLVSSSIASAKKEEQSRNKSKTDSKKTEKSSKTSKKDEAKNEDAAENADDPTTLNIKDHKKTEKNSEDEDNSSNEAEKSDPTPEEPTPEEPEPSEEPAPEEPEAPEVAEKPESPELPDNTEAPQDSEASKANPEIAPALPENDTIVDPQAPIMPDFIETPIDFGDDSNNTPNLGEDPNITPAPGLTQVEAPIESPIAAPNAPSSDGSPELIAPALVESNVLPPPPMPAAPAMTDFLPPENGAFDPSLIPPVQFGEAENITPAPAEQNSTEQFQPGVEQSAQAYVNALQNDNPAVQNTPHMDAGMPIAPAINQPQPGSDPELGTVDLMSPIDFNNPSAEQSPLAAPNLPAPAIVDSSESVSPVESPVGDPANAPTEAPAPDPGAFQIPGL